MKTRQYFQDELNRLKSELKTEINSIIYSKSKEQNTFVFYNEDDCNKIHFINIMDEFEIEADIDFIEVCDDNIIIYPKLNDLNPIDLDGVEDVHDLMLIHYFVL